MAKYSKLVRDKIPEILDKKGVRYVKRVAKTNEYKQELIKKLEEEVTEFIEAKDSSELADVQEVVNALKKLPEYKNTEKIRVVKLKERGGFNKRLILKGNKG